LLTFEQIVSNRILLHSSFFILHSSFFILHSSFLIYHLSFIIYHLSFIIYHSTLYHLTTWPFTTWPLSSRINYSPRSQRLLVEFSKYVFKRYSYLSSIYRFIDWFNELIERSRKTLIDWDWVSFIQFSSIIHFMVSWKDSCWLCELLLMLELLQFISGILFYINDTSFCDSAS
jgi:hypothetical protein